MTAYDVRARATAARLLAPISKGGKGQTFVVTHPGVSTYDPATQTTSEGSPTVETASGLEKLYTLREIDGTLIKAGDRRLVLSPLQTSGRPLTGPGTGSLITVGGEDWRVERCEPVAPAGTVLCFFVQLRRGGG